MKAESEKSDKHSPSAKDWIDQGTPAARACLREAWKYRKQKKGAHTCAPFSGNQLF